MESIRRSGPEKVLEKMLGDLQIRAEVDATVQSMLIDIEVAASLQKEVDTQSQLTELKEKVLQYESALSEAQAVQTQKRQEQSSLADSLVHELWTLSQELGRLRRWKETHETTLTEHDEVIAKLFQAEEQIRVLESRTGAAMTGEDDFGAFGEPVSSFREPQGTIVAMIPEPSTLQEMSGAAVSGRPSPPKPETKVQNKRNDVETEANDPESIEKHVDDLLTLDPNESNAQEDDIQSKQVPSDSAPDVKSERTVSDGAAGAAGNADDSAVVALLHEEEGDVPSLDTLDMKILTNIFEFLDALEILNTAQINVTMFSRVDTLFGFGGGMPDVAEEPAVASVPQEPPLPPRVEPAPAASHPSDPLTTSPGLNKPPAKPFQPNAKMPAQQSSITASMDAPRRGGIFSLLQARGSGLPVRRNAAGTAEHPLSAAMTDSMVAKLTDKELSAIFSLTEKLHQREKAVAALAAEKEELIGKLEGTEALKKFLINKVRDVEQSLKKSQEDEMKVTQQISSDQEVIAFLDGRVQELEREVKSLSEEKKNIAEEMSRMQSQNNKKIEVLGDMLQFERERISENEREWKATKKLLVKEIKSCRAQLLAMQAERDGFREQNERLKKAVLLTNPSSGSMM